MKLKNAGRSMVVISIEGTKVVCAWYNASSEVRGAFPIDALELVPTVTFLQTPRPMIGRPVFE